MCLSFRMQVKANALNPKIFEPPVLGVRVERKLPTVPVPFKLTEIARKVRYLLQHFCFINIFYSYTVSACGVSITFSI